MLKHFVPLPDKTMWPRLQNTLEAENILPDCSSWPKISIVTPSYNHATFIEATIRSVLLQGYPNFEYIIIDGGSTDGTVDIINKYEEHLTYWVSEKDAGQYDAINKGFAKSTGDIMFWLNSDDMLCPWAFHVAATVFKQCLDIEWLTSSRPLLWSQAGLCIAAELIDGFSKKTFYQGRNIKRNHYFHFHIQQESTFWRRSLWLRSGGCLNADIDYAGDFDLWARFWEFSDLVCINAPLGGWRHHGDQKVLNDYQRYLVEAAAVLQRYAYPTPSSFQIRIRSILTELFPRLSQYLAEKSMHVAIDPVSGHCRRYCRYIV
jgi:glycosyltransferase involved in cell wall biosynthesis